MTRSLVLSGSGEFKNLLIDIMRCSNLSIDQFDKSSSEMCGILDNRVDKKYVTADTFPQVDLDSPDCSDLRSIIDNPEHAGLHLLVRLTARVLHVPTAFLALWDERLEITSCIGGQGAEALLRRLPKKDLEQGPLMLSDASLHPRLASHPMVAGSAGVRFLATAPVRTANGLALGVLAIADCQLRAAFSSEDRETLVELASIVAVKMELRTVAYQAFQTQTSLRESQQRFRVIADCAPVLIWMAGIDGGATFLNKSWIAFSGRSLGEDLGDGWLDGIHPDHRDKCAGDWWAAFDSRLSYASEYPMLRADGQYRWVLNRAVPRMLADGNFDGYIGCCVDINEEYLKGQEFEDRYRFMSPVVEASGALVSVLDSEGRIQHFDAGCTLLTGHSEATIMGRFFWDALPCAPVCVAQLQSAIWRSVAARETTTLEALCSREGRTSAISWRFSPLTDSQSGAHVVATGFDVSDKKKAEESQSRLAAIVESSDDAIIMESDGTIVSWNAAAERIYGYRSEEVIGQPLRMLIPDEEWSGRVAEILVRARNGEPVRHSQGHALCKDGAKPLLDVTVFPVRNSLNKIVGTCAILRSPMV